MNTGKIKQLNINQHNSCIELRKEREKSVGCGTKIMIPSDIEYENILLDSP